jgi:KUP system potassium uptake protein
LIFTMYIWYKARKINNRFLHFIDLKDQIPLLTALSADQSIAKYSSQLIYLTKANNSKQIEEKIMYSIRSRSPKRADTYWFLHIDTTDEPYTMEYIVDQIEPGKIIRIDFRLGFRIQPRVNVLYRKVIEDMVARGELDITSKYDSLNKFKVVSDFKFVIMEKFLSYNNLFSISEGFILNSYFTIKKLALAEAKAFGLDTSDTQIEKIPLVVKPATNFTIKRIDPVSGEAVH